MKTVNVSGLKNNPSDAFRMAHYVDQTLLIMDERAGRAVAKEKVLPVIGK